MCSWLIGPSPASTRSISGGVALDQPLDRRADAVLGQAAHFEQPRLELLELFLESAGRRVSGCAAIYPNLPVT